MERRSSVFALKILLIYTFIFLLGIIFTGGSNDIGAPISVPSSGGSVILGIIFLVINIPTILLYSGGERFTPYWFMFIVNGLLYFVIFYLISKVYYKLKGKQDA